MNNSIEIKGLNKFYGKKQALYDVSLSIHGGMFGLLGRNGAGKTTLMKTLATLLQKKDGEVTVCGVPIEKAEEIRRIIGYLPQEFSMYPSMKVGEAMEYLAILSGLSGAERKERIDALLKKVNLTEHRDKKVKALSGGMKRRLGIAQALLNNPKVLIVDEPTAGLDPEERVRFRNLLSEIAEDKIVILSTHIVGDIEATCEDIAIINEGRVIYNGTVDALLQAAEGKVFMLTSAVTGNTVIGYMPPLLYYALNIGMGPKLGSFYLFSMVTGSYTAKLWMFVAGILMMAAALFYLRIPSYSLQSPAIYVSEK